MKKIIAFVMASLVVLSTLVGNLSFADTVHKPYLRIITPAEVQEVKAGEDSKYAIRVENTGNYPATPLTVRIAGDHPFRLDSSNLVKDVEFFSSSSEKIIYFDVVPSPLAQSRIYEFDVIFEYEDGMGMTQSNTEKAYVKIDNNKTAPILSVKKTFCNVDPAPADVINSLNITLKNSGTMAANNIKATLQGMDAQGIMLYNDADTKAISSIGGDCEEIVNFMFKPSTMMKPGLHTMTLHVVYNDELGTEYVKDIPVYVNIGNNALGGSIQIQNISYPDAVSTGNDFVVSYQVVNNSNQDITNLVADFTYDDGAFIAKKNSKVFIDKIVAGGSKNISVTMGVRSGVSSDTYHSYVVVKNGQNEEAPEVAKEYVGLYIDSKAGGGNRPKLIIEKYEYGEHAKAGEEFDLVLHIKNTSESQATKNIKVALSSSEGIFVPVDSSSSLYVDYIGPGETKTATMRFKTKLDAAVKIYPVDVKMEYEDGKGNAFDAQNNPFTESESLSIFVYQDTVLTVNDPYMDYEVYAGDSMDIDVEFYNEGRSPMTNLKVTVEGVEVRENTYYVGNFEQGKSDMFSITAENLEEGEHEGKFIFEFQNPMGEVKTQEMPFMFYVSPADQKPMPGDEFDEFKPGMDEDMEEAEGFNWKLWGGIGAGVLLLVIIIIVIITKHKKKMKNLKELEDIFNE